MLIFTMTSSMNINITLDTSTGSLVYSFENNKIINTDSFSQTYFLTSDIYSQAGSFELTLSGSDDDSSNSDSYVLYLTVNDIASSNNAPIITSNPITSVDENTAYHYQVTATDTDGDSLTYSLVQAPSWLTINSNTGLISGTAPMVNINTNYNIRVQVSDGIDTDTQTYTLTVENTIIQSNNAPIITSNPITSVNENTFYTYDVNAVDVNRDVITYSLTQSPNWLTINSNTGLISGTAPIISADTNYTMTIQASDGIDTDTQTYTLTVNNIASSNNVPIISSTPRTSINENRRYQYQVIATDADNDILTYSLTQSPSWLTINPDTGMIRGDSPEINSDKEYNITISVSDGIDVTTQTYTLIVKNSNSYGERDSDDPIKVIQSTDTVTDDFYDEQSIYNNVSFIKAESYSEPTKQVGIKNIYWLIILTLLILIILMIIALSRLNE